MKALKKLLKAAKVFDEETGQGGCEQESKIALIRQLMDYVGLEAEDIFPDV